MDRTPLFTLGWFRSGTTHLFRLVRSSLPEWTHFYEPFNPRVGRFTSSYHSLQPQKPGHEDQLFDWSGKAELFRSYTRINGSPGEHFRAAFGQRDFFLTRESSYPALRKYLRLLTTNASPVHLQVNRGLGRVGFLRKLYPGGTYLCIVRDPRAVWASWHDYPDDPFNPELPPDTFFLDVMLRELEQLLPTSLWRRWGFEWAENQPPVASFLAVWGFLHQMTHREVQSARSSAWIRYEDLVRNTEAMVQSLGRELGLDGLETKELPGSHSESIHRWRQQSNPAEYRALLDSLPEDNHLTTALRSFGYFEGTE